jgi:Protein kinase domain/IPT/TIG domain
MGALLWAVVALAVALGDAAVGAVAAAATGKGVSVAHVSLSVLDALSASSERRGQSPRPTWLPNTTTAPVGFSFPTGAKCGAKPEYMPFACSPQNAAAGPQGKLVGFPPISGNASKAWRGGQFWFMDPVPQGNELLDLNISFSGRFNCEPASGIKATFIAFLQGTSVMWNRIDMLDAVGCNCGTVNNFTADTVRSASFSTMGSTTTPDFSSYSYNGNNSFHVVFVTNQVCLVSVNLSLYYAPVKATVLKAVPDKGPMSGDTPVVVFGTGFTENSNFWECQFGPWGVSVAKVINGTALSCNSVAAPSAGPVDLRVSNNGRDWSATSVVFTFAASSTNDDASSSGSTPTLGFLGLIAKQYWWAVVLVVIVVALGVAGTVAACVARRKRRRIALEDAGVMNRRGINRPYSQGSEHGTPLHQRMSWGDPNFSQAGTAEHIPVSGGQLAAIREDLDFAELDLLEKIGRGNYGDVFLANWRETQVAVKCCKMPPYATAEEMDQFIADFEHEATLMKSLRHPNVVQFLGISKVRGDSGVLDDRPSSASSFQSSSPLLGIGSGDICIVTEFMSQGSVHRILHDHSGHPQISWQRKLAMAIDVARGMHYLHSCDPVVIHRDLKSHK